MLDAVMLAALAGGVTLGVLVAVLIARRGSARNSGDIAVSLVNLERQIAALSGGQEVMSNALDRGLKDNRTEIGARVDALSETVRRLGAEQGEQQNLFRDLVDKKMAELRRENEAKLNEMRQTVDEHLQTTLEKRISESFKAVSERLEAVQRGLGEMQDMQVGVRDLKRVLTDVKARGTYGEVQLDTLISDILTAEQYVSQYMIDGGAVDFAVRLPGDDGGTVLPIDAKFPTEDYDRLLTAADAGNQAGVDEAALALERRVKRFAKAIADKYIRPPETTDWAILFLPTEGLYAELLRRPGLFETLQRDFRVTLAGPTNLQVLLYTFRMGFRHAALSEQAREVWGVLGKVKAEFEKYGEWIDSLDKTAKSLQRRADDFSTRRNVMLRALKSVEETGASLPDDSPAPPHLTQNG